MSTFFIPQGGYFCTFDVIQQMHIELLCAKPWAGTQNWGEFDPCPQGRDTSNRGGAFLVLQVGRRVPQVT